MSLQYATALMLLLFSTAVPVYSRRGVKGIEGIKSTKIQCGSLSESICDNIVVDMEYSDGCDIIFCNKGKGYRTNPTMRCLKEDESNPRDKEYCDKMRNKFFWTLQNPTPPTIRRLQCKGFDRSYLKQKCVYYQLEGTTFMDGCYDHTCKDGDIAVSITSYCIGKEEEGNPRHKKFCDDIRFKLMMQIPQNDRGEITLKWNLQPSAIAGGSSLRTPGFDRRKSGLFKKKRKQAVPSFTTKQNSYGKVVCDVISFKTLSALCRQYLLNVSFSDGCSTMKCRNGNEFFTRKRCPLQNGRSPSHGTYCERVDKINFMVFRWNLPLPKYIKNVPSLEPLNLPQVKCMGIYYNMCPLFNEMFWDGCNVITCDHGRHSIATRNHCPNENTARHTKYCQLVRIEYDMLMRESLNNKPPTIAGELLRSRFG